MNYLAHAYLSFHHPQILVGNMISDYVKGKKKFDFPTGIQFGIMLHREIDSFTDRHEATLEAKAFFKPDYRLYAGAFVDVIYDYFLANDENEFSDNSLMEFANNTYAILSAYSGYFPEKFDWMFPYMKEKNWLYNYRHKWGTAKSMNGLVKRSAYLSESEIAFNIFEKNLGTLQLCYTHFWADLKPFAKNQFEKFDRL
ncbi:MAG TPA: ACP phosphodiesterase [Chitinophagaceae bacterium]|mgnify:CR=1 FL=1|nr:ACP phosphodiesterase [Chitinophagaceae bacterium]